MFAVQTLNKALTRAQFLSTMNQCDCRTNLSQQQRVLRGRVAAADNTYIFASELIAIART